MNSIDTDTATAITDIADKARLAFRALSALVRIAVDKNVGAYVKALWRNRAGASSSGCGAADNTADAGVRAGGAGLINGLTNARFAS